MRELTIPTRNTNPIHNDVLKNRKFLLFDQPSGEANTTGTLINKINEIAINAKTANWKAIVMFLFEDFELDDISSDDEWIMRYVEGRDFENIVQKFK